jgi:hypothetical protein
VELNENDWDKETMVKLAPHNWLGINKFKQCMSKLISPNPVLNIIPLLLQEHISAIPATKSKDKKATSTHSSPPALATKSIQVANAAKAKKKKVTGAPSRGWKALVDVGDINNENIDPDGQSTGTGCTSHLDSVADDAAKPPEAELESEVNEGVDAEADVEVVAATARILTKKKVATTLAPSTRMGEVALARAAPTKRGCKTQHHPAADGSSSGEDAEHNSTSKTRPTKKLTTGSHVARVEKGGPSAVKGSPAVIPAKGGGKATAKKNRSIIRR